MTAVLSGESLRSLGGLEMLEHTCQTLILCIHEVTSRRQGDDLWTVEANRLDHLLERLIHVHWLPSSLRDNMAPHSARKMIVTIDDARSGAISWLLSSATAAKLKVSIFPIPLFIDNAEAIPVRERYSTFASCDQLRETILHGHSIGSHALTHRALSQLPVNELTHELFQSQRWLEDRLQCQVRDLALPYGASNDDVLRLARAAGYRYVLTTEPRCNTASDFAKCILNRFLLRSDQPNLGLPDAFFC